MCARVFKIKGDFIQHGKTCKPPSLQPLSEQDVVDMIKKTSSSDRQVLSMISDLKKKYGNDIVTPNIQILLRDRKSLLDDFFKVKSEVFFDKCGKEKRANVVYCKNTNDFIKFVCDFRGLNPEDVDHLVGLDEGKGRFIITYSCIPRLETTNINNNNFESSGAKQSFILCCAEQIPELYVNAKIMYDLIHLREVSAKFVCDLKLTNILLGLSSHASKHPCPYGTCYKGPDGIWVSGEQRTFASISNHSENWREQTGGDRKKLKNFFNCEFEPLMVHLGDEPVLVHLPPPPLHLVDLGPVNNVLHSLEETCGDFTDAWRTIGVKREVFHGRNFNGNEVNKILKKLDVLERFVPPQYRSFINCLEAVKKMKESVCR